MHIGSSSASFFIKHLAGGDPSSLRFQKAVDTTGKPSLSEMPLPPAASPDSAAGRSPETPFAGFRGLFSHLGLTGGAIYIEDVVRIADAAMKDAKEQLDSAFASAGIHPSPPVRFCFDLQGQLAVDDHPQKEQIQKLLSENDGLARNIHQAMVLKENAVSWQQAADFTEAYQRIYVQKGPQAALALMERFMAIGSAKASFRYGADGFTGLFNGKPERE